MTRQTDSSQQLAELKRDHMGTQLTTADIDGRYQERIATWAAADQANLERETEEYRAAYQDSPEPERWTWTAVDQETLERSDDAALKAYQDSPEPERNAVAWAWCDAISGTVLIGMVAMLIAAACGFEILARALQ